MLSIIALIAGKNRIISYEEAVHEFSTPYSHFTEWKGVKLHYIDRGQGTPVMLLHGYAGSFDNWSVLAENFPGNYRLIIPDLPGLGLSQFPEDLPLDVSYIDLYTDFTHHLIEELELDSLYIVGNSLGGLLAWETTIREPRVKKLVLLNAAGYSIEDVGSYFIKFSQSRMFEIVAKRGTPKIVARQAAKGCLGDKSKLDKERVEAFSSMLNKEGTLEAIGRLGSSGQYPDSTQISQVNVPTLIIWGDKDGVIPVSHSYKFHRDIKGSELEIYEGSGHVPMLENPDRLRQDLIRFFDGPVWQAAVQ